MLNTKEKLIEKIDPILKSLPWGQITPHTAEDIGCDVLFVRENKSYGVGAYSDTYRDFFSGQFPVKGVTHWMPLPQPPEGE